MTDTYFPPLSEEALWSFDLILKRITEDPNYLHSDDCPYGEALVNALSPIETEVVAIESGEAEDTEVDLALETRVIYNELKTAKASFAEGDHSEKMSYFRVSTALLEKLVSMQERALNIRDISRFYSAVLAILEEVAEPGQVSEIRERLKEFMVAP
jgi:hypothetical protein